jgi:AcrR family transcriptional regulator
LLEHGNAGVTMRKVAEKAGISLGNVTYHFPTKRHLLLSLIGGLTVEYEDHFNKILDIITPDPKLTSDKLVRWLLADAAEFETMAIMRELWAMSLHDDVIRDRVDDFYDRHMSDVSARLQELFPELGPQAAAEYVQTLAMLSEGTTVLYGTRRDRQVPLERSIEKTCEIMREFLLLRGAASD